MYGAASEWNEGGAPSRKNTGTSVCVLQTSVQTPHHILRSSPQSKLTHVHYEQASARARR